MNCKESKEKICSMAWQDPPVQKEAALASHLEECASCSRFYDNYSKGVQGILNELRTEADSQLYEAIVMRMQKRDSDRQFYIRRPVMKLAYSLVAGVAAVLGGILAGRSFISNTLNPAEKESYKQEISMQSSDLSGLNANMLDYVDYINPEEK